MTDTVNMAVEALTDIRTSIECAAGCDEGGSRDTAYSEILSAYGTAMASAYSRAVGTLAALEQAGEPVDKKQKMDAMWKVLREYRLEDGKTVAELIKSGHDRISILALLVDDLEAGEPAPVKQSLTTDGDTVADETFAFAQGIVSVANSLQGRDAFDSEIVSVKLIRACAQIINGEAFRRAGFPTLQRHCQEGGSGEGKPVAYAPKGHVERYLKGKNTACWVYGSPTGEDDQPLYAHPPQSRGQAFDGEDIWAAAKAIHRARFPTTYTAHEDYWQQLSDGGRQKWFDIAKAGISAIFMALEE